MYHPSLTIALLASMAIPARRILVQDGDASATLAVDDAVVPIGLSQRDGDAEAGFPVDIDALGFGEVEFGGDVAVNDPLTAAADGRAIKAVPAAGESVAIVGYAASAGDAGTFGAVRIAPGQFTVAAA